MTALLKPAAVEPGASISVIAPSSAPQPERLERGMAKLRALGFAPRLSQYARERGPLFFAGTAEERLADLHAAFADPATSAVMALRGGYGSNYLLDGLDLDLIRKHPKPFFAYSDLTGLQLYLLDQICLPAFHGPMVAANFSKDDGVDQASFEAAISGRPYSLGAADGMRVLKPGTARGVLYGGCMSIMVSMLGTSYEPQTEGKLLFLEDTGTKPYQVDRLLWQLREAGKLKGVRGIVFGEMRDCVSPGAPADLLEEVLRSNFDDFDGPIAIGLRSGHVSRADVTLTFGVEAELTVAENATLRLMETAVKQ
jgi:muramoyltetrapeptide carboxypeptidase